MLFRAFFLLISILSHQFVVAGTAEQSRDEFQERFLELDWKGVGIYQLSKSNSIISVPENHVALIGKDAIRERFLVDGNHQKEVEAVVYGDDFSGCVVFGSFNDGYVKLEDWNEINPKQLLASINAETEKGNADKIKYGISTIHVVGWMQEPVLDRTTNTVFWAIEAKDDEGSAFVNSVALRLGLKGYEKLVWVVDKDLYVPFGGELDIMLRAHSFKNGFRYSDYKSGDKVATYSIATLVAATVGGKIIKGTGFLVFFKKIGGFIFALIAAAFYKLKNIFVNGKKNDCE